MERVRVCASVRGCKGARVREAERERAGICEAGRELRGYPRVKSSRRRRVRCQKDTVCTARCPRHLDAATGSSSRAESDQCTGPQSS
jgi:hypothetical protein